MRKPRRHTGYKGQSRHLRAYAHEQIAELVYAPLADVREASKANGMHELQKTDCGTAGRHHCYPDEVMRVVFTAGSYPTGGSKIAGSNNNPGGGQPKAGGEENVL